MSNIGAVLKAEITRLARREVRVLVEPLRKANAAQRREIAALKRQLADIEKQARERTGKRVVVPPPAEPDGKMPRITAKGVKSLRARLGLSAEEFGRLVGASGQSVYNWEDGVQPRSRQRIAIAGLRGIGKREARARLEEQSTT